MGRKIGSRTYEYHKYRGNKKDAKYDAKELRELGFSARVLPESDGGHGVWRSKKRKKAKGND